MARFTYSREPNFGFNSWPQNPSFDIPLSTSFRDGLVPDENVSLGHPSTYTITMTQYGELITCKFCNVSCTGRISYEQHLHGSRHRKNTQHKENFTCTACDTSFTSFEQRDAHLNGHKHRQKLLALSPSVAQVPHSSSTHNNQGPFRCISCNLDCSSLSQLNQHLMGKKHTKTLKMQRYKRNSGSELSVSASESEYPHRIAPVFPDNEVVKGVQSPGSSVDTPVGNSEDPMSRLMELESTLSGLRLSSFPSLHSCYANTGSNSANSTDEASKTERAVVWSNPTTLETAFCKHRDCIIERALLNYEMTLRSARHHSDKMR
ncbi:hypothetical protein CRM22_008912 [Opisthorchis felineus]|uniref:C2H2-type domain-containing protein n=1 Tax=Opisthorchis felineus TaxID=147828 RepID=A0A4S2L9L5_OPIFE|nr:hypothetical protein CRM22_008912 [Opisthorchis felineus]TGZ59723.1 hypothetical protein CRM22_008912 [Opisthorchis felineus]